MAIKTIDLEGGKTLSGVFEKFYNARGRSFIVRYRTSSMTEITQLYKNPSSAKKSIFEAIREEKVEMGGYDLRVNGGNMYLFSCAYRIKDVSGREYLVYYTWANRYIVLL